MAENSFEKQKENKQPEIVGEKCDRLRLLGEIIKAVANVSSFNQFMTILTQILIDTLDVSCYVWMQTESTKIDNYTLFYRTTTHRDELREKRYVSIPSILKNLTQTTVYNNHLISLMKDKEHLAGAQIAIPLKSVNAEKLIGTIVVGHEEEKFFDEGTRTFFEVLGVFISTNVHNSKLLHSAAEKSIRDPLTDIYNRRYLSVALEKLIRQYNNVTVAVIDTDNFKRINDKLGHMEGDVVLKGIAQLAQGIIRESYGEVIRYGGDEFVMLIPKQLAEALTILEEFRKSVEYLKIAYDMKTNLSVTVGVCAYPEMLKDAMGLVQAADNALIRGKVYGKNRITLANQTDMNKIIDQNGQ